MGKVKRNKEGYILSKMFMDALNMMVWIPALLYRTREVYTHLCPDLWTSLRCEEWVFTAFYKPVAICVALSSLLVYVYLNLLHAYKDLKKNHPLSNPDLSAGGALMGVDAHTDIDGGKYYGDGAHDYGFDRHNGQGGDTGQGANNDAYDSPMIRDHMHTSRHHQQHQQQHQQRQQEMEEQAFCDQGSKNHSYHDHHRSGAIDDTHHPPHHTNTRNANNVKSNQYSNHATGSTKDRPQNSAVVEECGDDDTHSEHMRLTSANKIDDDDEGEVGGGDHGDGGTSRDDNAVEARTKGGRYGGHSRGNARNSVQNAGVCVGTAGSVRSAKRGIHTQRHGNEHTSDDNADTLPTTYAHHPRHTHDPHHHPRRQSQQLPVQEHRLRWRQQQQQLHYHQQQLQVKQAHAQRRSVLVAHQNERKANAYFQIFLWLHVYASCVWLVLIHSLRVLFMQYLVIVGIVQDMYIIYTIRKALASPPPPPPSAASSL